MGEQFSQDKHLLVRALRQVQDNGVMYPKGKIFQMEESLARAHAAESVVEILGAVQVVPVTD